MKTLLHTLALSCLLACGDAPKNADDNSTAAKAETVSAQDKMETVALFMACNTHDYKSQREFLALWEKLDVKHQLDALEQIIRGHNFEVSTDIRPLVEEHKKRIEESKNEDSDNERMKALAKESSTDVAQHAFYLRQAIVFWDAAKKSKDPTVLKNAKELERDLLQSITHFAQVVRFVDVYSMIPMQDSLPCENLDAYHCELEGKEYDVLRIHLKKGTDPSVLDLDDRILDFLRFSKIHFMIDGQEDVNLALTPNPVIDFENTTYIEELFDFLATFGHYEMKYDKNTKKYKLEARKGGTQKDKKAPAKK